MGNVHEELEELKQRYAVMVEMAPEAIVVFGIEHGRFVEVNEQACRLFGMSRERLLEVGPVDVSPEYQPDGRRSADAAGEHIRRALDGAVSIFEWVHRLAGGDALCRVHLVRVPTSTGDLVRGSVLDISEARESARERDRFRAILDMTPDLVGIATPDGRPVYLNAAGRALLGIGPDEDLALRSVSDFHTPASAARQRSVGIPAAIERGRWRGESELRGADGRVVPVSQVILAQRNAAGEVELLSTIARDMSDRVAAEAMQRKVLHAQKLESLGVLAGGIAHDFNNILVGVLANASLVMRLTEGDDRLHPLAAEIVTASERAAELAQQMLSYAGKTQVPRGPIDLPALVEDVSHLVRSSISRSASLDFAFAAGVPPIHGDPAQLRQVLMNLVLNASDAIGERAGEIRVRTALAPLERGPVTHNYLPPRQPEQRYVMLEVSDTGEGMEPELLDRIFDPFFTTKVTGRGLGLAGVLGVVKAHHAAVQVSSAPGQGTTFRLWFLPAERSGESGAAAAPEDDTTSASQPAGKRVLVVDDEAVVRRAVRALLGFHGFEVLEADGGVQAEAVFRERAAEIDAVLLDLTMPGESGREVLARLRAIHAGVPVVLTSGFSDEVDDDLADGFVAKPFTADQLVEALRKVMR